MMKLPLTRLCSLSLGKKSLHWLYRWYKLVWVFSFFVVLGVGVWQWYYNTERYSWTNEQKKAFWEEYAHEIDFRESRFESALHDVTARAALFASGREVSRDIFRLRLPKESAVSEPEPTARSASGESSDPIQAY